MIAASDQAVQEAMELYQELAEAAEEPVKELFDLFRRISDQVPQLLSELNKLHIKQQFIDNT